MARGAHRAIHGKSGNLCYSAVSMRIIPEFRAAPPPEANIKGILEWLVLAHGRPRVGDPRDLLRQLIALRDTPLPYAERVKLLDLFFRQTERTVRAELPSLRKNSLPIPRRLRQRTKLVLDVLGTLTQDYLNTLAELFDPRHASPPPLPDAALIRVMQAIGWQARLAHLAASPPPSGLWQQLHGAFRTACQLGLEDVHALPDAPSARRIYSNILLEGIAQPASFASGELDLAGAYIASHTPELSFGNSPPADDHAVFWIDPDKDVPAHALVRRQPDPEAKVLYFSCDAAAESANHHRMALLRGVSAETLGLPAIAGTHAGPGILWRLGQLWGHPVKRRYTRRRQSYRTRLCLGLDNIRDRHRGQLSGGDLSEWMVINESPDGFALMHIAGYPEHLGVGQLVALQPAESTRQAWQLCIIRWALSENPEHIELGLQMLSPQALAVEVALPEAPAAGKIPALLLPAAPPVRPTASLVVPAGSIAKAARHLIVLREEHNLHIQELQVTGLDEQTGVVEVFSVSPDGSPPQRSDRRTG